MNIVRACFENRRGSAARDFGRSLGGEAQASPKRALSAEPTTAAAKRPAARRVFAPKALWLCRSSVEDPPGIWASQALPFSFPNHGCALARKAVSFVAPRHRAFGAKTEPFLFSKHALSPKRTLTSLQPSPLPRRARRGRACDR